MKSLLLKTFLFVFLAIFLVSGGIFLHTLLNNHALAVSDTISVPNSDYSPAELAAAATKASVTASSTPSATTSAPIVHLPVAIGDTPATLTIPSIGVNATIERVGVTAAGNLAVPKIADDVGWYGAGPKAGANGTVVIDGHLDTAWTSHGVFEKLKDLQPNDDIYIKDGDGTIHHYVVSSSRSYDISESASSIFQGPDDTPRLALITCDGTWLKDQKTYDKRMVVFATLSS